MLRAIHARPVSSHGSISPVEPSSPTTVKFSDASNRVTSSRLRTRSVRVDNHDRHVFDVRGRRISEHRELNDRRHDDNAEQPRVLPQLQHFFTHQMDDARHVRAYVPARHSRPSRTDASVSAIAAKMASASMSCQNAWSGAPLSTIARSATRK